jgi:hypothetical protein
MNVNLLAEKKRRRQMAAGEFAVAVETDMIEYVTIDSRNIDRMKGEE